MQYDLLRQHSQWRPPEDIRVLVGCEKSGVGRNAFLDLGYDAYSCDLLPADDRSNRHMQVDLIDILDDGWDMLVVLHPPCKRLCNSSVRWLTGPTPPKGRTFDDMWRELEEGAKFFSQCWNAPVKHKAVENPVMNPYAAERIENFRPPAQTVQPWWFGCEAFKATSFWLEELEPLMPTIKLIPPKKEEEPLRHAKWSAIHRASPGPDRTNIRSKTFPGLAKAFAKQWGDFVCHYAITDHMDLNSTTRLDRLSAMGLRP